ncbi:MAG TPA: helix-turn-helix transcriptional regulator [Bacillota bacterium]|nr:helix-turn-helix transcriptional regulator [Bacillota bacterium]HOL10727.1 helix-turn-helix transcriptional regulator [Bacillota bacterium]HPO98397.1 helix-turn-helix transcriptional regulator [Bacillota bacterium]
MFAERLKLLREEKELKQEHVAEYLGVTQQTYSRYENGINEPDIESIKKLAIFFEVSTDYLLGLTDKRYYALEKLPKDIQAEAHNFIEFLLEKKKKKGKS